LRAAKRDFGPRGPFRRAVMGLLVGPNFPSVAPGRAAGRKCGCALANGRETMRGVVAECLVTERLVLRRVTPADVDNLLALDGDPEVMRYLDHRVKTRAEVEAEVLPLFLGPYQRYPGFGRWAAETRAGREVASTNAGGEFVGWFGLRPVEPSEKAIVDWADAPPGSGVAEIGYRLRRSAWSRGYATEGARALVRRAFTELGIDEIVATTMTVNTRSRGVMENAGLRYARTVHLTWPDPLDGNEHGDVEYRLRREDWES
jgi:RimJ/RimL family protein N-acetyltransferase